MSVLEKLLLEISKNEEEGFDYDKASEWIAKEFILNSSLIVSESEYSFAEIEIYTRNGFHDDPFVHSNQYKNVCRQYEFGEWYFHRFNSIDKYTHRMRGLDLTFGNKDLQFSGGILIRGIKSLSDGKIIQGPSNVVGEIKSQLEKLDSEYSLEYLAKSIGRFAFNAKSPLRIEENGRGISKLLRVKRFGLSEKKEDVGNKYFNKAYRFIAKDVEYIKTLKDRYKVVIELLNNEQIEKADSVEILGYNSNFSK